LIVQVADDKRALFAEAVKERQPYYQKRIELFEKYHQREEAAIETAKAANVPMKVTLPDGAIKDGIKGVTTPLDVANMISKSLAKKVIVAKVDGDVWDLFRPLEGDCNISLHTFDEPEGKEVRATQRIAAAVAPPMKRCLIAYRLCRAGGRWQVGADAAAIIPRQYVLPRPTHQLVHFCE
jgi:hypothetical protein